MRQIVVVRDESGQVSGLPHVERAIANCLEAIRRVRASRGAKASKLDMNHVWVQIWPTIEADLSQLTALQDKIAPVTAGAGIEEVLVQAHIAGAPGEAPLPIAGRFFYQPGSGSPPQWAPPTEPLKPWTTTPPRWSGPDGAASSTPTSSSR